MTLNLIFEHVLFICALPFGVIPFLPLADSSPTAMSVSVTGCSYGPAGLATTDITYIGAAARLASKTERSHGQACFTLPFGVIELLPLADSSPTAMSVSIAGSV